MIARHMQIRTEQQRLDGGPPVLERMRADSSEWPRPRGSAITPGTSRPPTRVMVIDDSLTIRMVVKTCLTRAGCEVVDFPDGIQALRWLMNAEDTFPPDLILLDLEVPNMDWHLVMQRLKAHAACADTTLVMLSRRDGLLDRLQSRLAGAHAYLAKPFRTQELLTVIHHYCSSPDH